MKVKLFLIIWVLSLVSCKTKQIPVFVERVVKDSIVVRDTIQEVLLEPYYEEISTKDTVSYLTNKYAYSEAKINNNELYHNLGIWQTPIGIKTIKLTEYKLIKEPVPYEVEKIVKIEKNLTWWQKIRMRIGEIALLFILVFVGFRLRKIS